MQQSTSCESAQAGTGAINAPIANTTASTFRNRNMDGRYLTARREVKFTAAQNRNKSFSRPAEAV